STAPKRRSASTRAACGDIPSPINCFARSSRWMRISSSASRCMVRRVKSRSSRRIPGRISEVMEPLLRRSRRRSEDVGYRLRVADPLRGLGGDARAPRSRDAIVPRPLIVLRHPPLGGDEIALLEAVERLIERAVADVERAARTGLDPARDLEAVHRCPAEGFEDEVVERAF